MRGGKNGIEKSLSGTSGDVLQEGKFCKGAAWAGRAPVLSLAPLLLPPRMGGPGCEESGLRGCGDTAALARQAQQEEGHKLLPQASFMRVNTQLIFKINRVHPCY